MTLTIDQLVKCFINDEIQDMLDRYHPKEPLCDRCNVTDICYCGNASQWSISYERRRSDVTLCESCLIVFCNEHATQTMKVRYMLFNWIDYSTHISTRSWGCVCYWCDGYDNIVHVMTLIDRRHQASGYVVCSTCVKQVLVRKYSYHFWLLQCMLHRDCSIDDVVVYCSSVCRSVFVM